MLSHLPGRKLISMEGGANPMVARALLKSLTSWSSYRRAYASECGRRDGIRRGFMDTARVQNVLKQ